LDRGADRRGAESIGFDDIINSLSSAERFVRHGEDGSDAGRRDHRLQAIPAIADGRMAVLIGIILFASVEAARQLGFGAMAVMLGQIVDLAVACSSA